MNPLVTVLMPVYNGEKYIREAINSVLKQSYVHFEFVIINDGSTDDSESIILSYKDNRIRYIKNERNLKLITTLNLGLNIANGKYIARMDADDICHPNRLARQVEFLEENHDYGLLGTSVKLIEENELEIFDVLKYHLDHESLSFALSFYCPFVHSSVMIRRNCLNLLDRMYNGDFLHAEDYELWSRIVMITKVANLSETLVSYRIHSSQVSRVYSDYQLNISNVIRAKYLENKLNLASENFSYVFNLSKDNKSLFQKYSEIRKLYKLNRNDSIFGGDNFRIYLIQLWRNETLDVSKISFKEIFVFLVSSPTYNIKWSLRQLISVLFKCFRF